MVRPRELKCSNELNHNRGYSFVSRFKIQIEIYLLNEGLSNLVEVGIEGHLNLKARRLSVDVRDGVHVRVLGEAHTIRKGKTVLRLLAFIHIY